MKTHSLVSRVGLSFPAALLLLATMVGVHAGGTIQLLNTSLTRVLWTDGRTPVPTIPGLVFYGVKWGTTRESMTLASVYATNSTTSAGLIAGSPLFEIPGTSEGQAVYLQVVAWQVCDRTAPDPRFGCEPYGETDIRLVTLGSSAGPGTVIWQSGTGTDPARFRPLTLGSPLTPPVQVGFYDSTFGNPITVDEGAQGPGYVPVRLLRANFPGGSLAGLTTAVWLVPSNGTAIAGLDFVPDPVLVTFGPGEAAKVGYIPLLPDAAAEPMEQFHVHLRMAGGYRAALGSLPLPVNIREARVAAARVQTNQAIVTIETTRLQRYAVDWSSDLVTWSPVTGAEEITGTGQPIDVPDPDPACCGSRFYRTRVLP